MTRTLVDIRYPAGAGAGRHDAFIDAHMAGLGYVKTDVGAGFGFRDMTFASTPQATHFDGEVRFWQEVGAELADLLGEPAIEIETRLDDL